MSTGSESQSQMYDLVLERIVAGATGEAVAGLDAGGTHQAVVHTRAVEDRRVRDRSQAGRTIQYHHGGAGGGPLPEQRLLPGDRAKPSPGVHGHPRRELPAPRARGRRHFTAAVSFEPTADGRGTRYVAHAMHATENGRRKHEEMGFHAGWGKALDQLAAYASTL